MAERNQTVICIGGMHRSGTSMITRLLNLCGMDLGTEADLMPASDANPEGYWEHIWFNYYNNQLLEFFRGAWDMVPVYPDNWQNTPGIAWIKREAGEMISRFKSPVWGWKDPRNSIAMPFWKQAIPGLRAVVCVRNPLDVANSLNKRGSSSILFGLQLWWQYSSMLLLDTTEAERVVTHFDVYFRDGTSELHRMADKLGLKASDAAIEEACKTSNGSLRHSVTDLEKLQKATPWPGLMETYCKMLVECGENCRALTPEWDRVEQLAAKWSPRSCCLPTVTAGHDLQKDAEQLQRRVAEAAQRLAGKELVHKQLMDEVMQRLERSTAAIEQLKAHRDELLRRHDKLLEENTAIRSSKTWKAMTKIGAIVSKTGLAKPTGQ